MDDVVNCGGGGSFTPGTGGDEVSAGDVWNHPGRPDLKKDAWQRAAQVARGLAVRGGFTDFQAAAQAGVFIDENACVAADYMKAEADGKGAKGTEGDGCGEGIGSWTFVSTKEAVLRAGGYDPSKIRIRNLNLEQQIDLVIAQSKMTKVGVAFKINFDALKRTKTLEQAMPAAFLITAGVGFSKNWKAPNIPTVEEALRASGFYGEKNDARYGKSAYHNNSFARRVACARKVLRIIRGQETL